MEASPIVGELASVVQTSLAPVFLLAGTAGFVSVYTLRLGRVSDRLNELTDAGAEGGLVPLQICYLQCRILALEIAVLFGVFAAICTSASILNLLAGALGIWLREDNLFWFFGGSLLCLMASLIAFAIEVLIAGRNMLRQIRIKKYSSE
ncbi:DUF2721 domain-containing protein [Agrobacterium tumefaciens]|uniref:DUF2721 domain-containing protein n=1 Tax=Agrobacterium tumefaciens TaxID=358 RepID=UPI0015728BB0|nr:DUF2721 domain-containing protein [Agrobacterium tumefaciens]NSX88019.1 DUF2721 domain-containing protein [Agrobacterium tumefaciens]